MLVAISASSTDTALLNSRAGVDVSRAQWRRSSFCLILDCQLLAVARQVDSHLSRPDPQPPAVHTSMRQTLIQDHQYSETGGVAVLS